MQSLSPLRKQIARISRYHPWYSDLLEQQGIDANSAELAELPLMTADILEKHYFTQQNRTEPGLSVYRTSGTSSGIRKAIYYSEEDDESYIASKADCFREFLEIKTNGGASAESRQLSVRTALADMGTGHAAGTALTIFERLGLRAESLSFSLPIEEHMKKLESFRPELLYTMPSILEAIARAASDPTSYGIRKIILVGEIATPEWQANMAQRFGLTPLDLLDTYGSIEIGAIASYSHELGQYVMADGVYAEAVPAERIDPRFEPLQENESVLVLTSYVRSLFPAIRYVTYDVVRDFRTIEIDGVPRQCFTCLSKRIGADLKHGEKISIYDIESVVHQFAKDAELRVRIRDNKLSVHIRSRALDDAMLAAISHALEHKIEDIGLMIKNRILDGIAVTRAADDEQLERGSVKSKKLYF
ncbi:phenylacetate--CoA ligase family protein [Paenibacillus arenilitoris]|uniref:CoF synthetase n=1 Tax=Paenibacillus arenilitoris TaxID=2772299 RepID=A0A927H892_9BACL|nr:hypothetical protein [Paenibacillus arenilitoris]MBD2871322.1 hypothetical protein [Paenibacillus arenilitoris]